MKAGIPGFQGERLRQAREAAGLTITSLADLVGVSKQAISQYEHGEDSPGPDVFDRIRKTLRHEAHLFLRPLDDSLLPGTCFYRSMASTTKAARTRAEVWKTWARELISYILEFVEFPPLRFPNFDLPSDPTLLSMKGIDEIAAELREFWNLGEEPIPNLVATAENNGVLVLRHQLDSDALDALSQWLEPEGLPLVILNADKNVSVRSRLDFGHELGHMILHRNMTSDYLRRSSMFRLLEDQAFRFGSALLLPEAPFLQDLYGISLDALLSQKLKWKTSVAMMIESLFYSGVINPDQRKRLRINYSVRQWNRQEPYDDEIKVEEPSFIIRSVRMIVDERLHTIDQISSSTGFSRQWIERLLTLPNDLFSPEPHLKLVEFKRHA